jgi:hypothetical protein
MWKKVLIGCSVALVLAVLAVAAPSFLSSRRPATTTPERPKIPSHLVNPAVKFGSDFLERMTWLEDSSLDSITDIVVGKLDPSPGIEIGVAGLHGAVLLDMNRNVKSRAMFDESGSHIDIIDAEGDGTCEFMDRGSWGQNPRLIDHAGHTVWTYGGWSVGVNDMAAGDIDGDGNLEYVVGFNGGGGVRLLDENGKKLWKKSDLNVWHVEMFDANGDGRLDIVHTNASGKIIVRDGSGKIISSVRAHKYLSKFSLCRWPAGIGKKYPLLAENSSIWLFGYDGRILERFNAPQGDVHGHARSAHVKFLGDQPKYLAVLVSLGHRERAILYIYDSKKNVVYHEVLPEDCQSLAPLALYDGKAESLLVGANGKVWQFRAQVAADAG